MPPTVRDLMPCPSAFKPLRMLPTPFTWARALLRVLARPRSRRLPWVRMSPLAARRPLVLALTPSLTPTMPPRLASRRWGAGLQPSQWVISPMPPGRMRSLSAFSPSLVASTPFILGRVPSQARAQRRRGRLALARMSLLPVPLRWPPARCPMPRHRMRWHWGRAPPPQGSTRSA